MGKVDVQSLQILSPLDLAFQRTKVNLFEACSCLLKLRICSDDFQPILLPVCKDFETYEHIFNKISQFIYKVNDKSKLKLIIEGTYIEQNSNLKFVPNDFYFESNIEDQIYNSIIKDDLNVFLSLLN